jgi:hypothetical protein
VGFLDRVRGVFHHDDEDEGPPPRDEIDGNLMGEPDDDEQRRRWRRFVREHRDLVTEDERQAVEEETD